MRCLGHWIRGGGVSAAATFTDEAAFIASAGPLGFESFEGLIATNSVSSGFSHTLPSFTVTATPFGGVFNLVDYFGTHATDGKNFVEVEGGTQQVLTFSFPLLIHEFGLIITDYGDVITNGSPLTFVTSSGSSGNAASSPAANANDQFFGFSDSSKPFTSISFSTPSGLYGDPFSVDAVRFTADKTSISEPITIAAFVFGLAGLGFNRRKRNW